MDFNVLIGGAAGQGMETLASILERVLKKNGFEVFTVRDYMSRVRGGHNFIQVRFADHKLYSHWDEVDGIIALNEETVEIHSGKLRGGGFIVCDEELKIEDEKLLKLPLKNIAKDIGNPRVFGNVALGAVLKLFGIGVEKAEVILKEYFNEEIAKQNVQAFNEGYKLVDTRFEAVSSGSDESILINGNEAIGLGAITANCKFYSAYPMTPSTSIMNYIASKMAEAEIVVEQAEDEIAAVMMAIGASYAGARAMTGTSGGGFSLMVEALGLSGMAEIPLVIANIQRPGPVTGLPTRTEQSDLKFVISASQGEFPRMVIAVRNPEDAFYQTVRAFNIADKYQIPVIIMGDQYLADYTTTLKPFDLNSVKIERHLSNDEYMGDREYKKYAYTDSGISPRIVPGKVPGQKVLIDSDEHDEYGMITESAEVRKKMVDKRMHKLELLKEELQEPEFIGEDDFDTLIVAWGSLYGPVKEAIGLLNEEGSVKKYGALVFGDIWPLPQGILAEKAKKAKSLINIEQNATGQLASVITEQTGIKCTSSLLKYDGRQLSAQEIYKQIGVK